MQSHELGEVLGAALAADLDELLGELVDLALALDRELEATREVVHGALAIGAGGTSTRARGVACEDGGKDEQRAGQQLP